MSYERLNLKNDDVLDETHLEHIEDGISTAWETAAIKLVASVTTTENSTSVEVTGLNILSPTVSIRIRNAGTNLHNGLNISVNGVGQADYYGSFSGSSTKEVTTNVWLFRDSGKLIGRAVMQNGGINVYDWGAFAGPITSVRITSAYTMDGETKYIQAGAIVDIYEGVYPNVK